MPLSREQFQALRDRGLSVEQIVKFEAGQRPAAAPTTSGGTGALERALAVLPALGGGVGGALGGIAGATAGGIGAVPGSLVGAGAGGAIGRVAEQTARRITGSPARPAEFMGAPLPAALDVPAEALGQAALQAGGVGIGAAAGRAGRGLMRQALGRAKSPATRGLADVALRERIPVGGRGDISGEEIAIQSARKSGKELNRMLRMADRLGIQVKPDHITREVTALLDDIAEQPIAARDRALIERRLSEFMAEHPGPMTPSAVKALKRRAQELAAPIIKNRKLRPGVSAREAIDARFNDAISRGARKSLEELPAFGPGIADIEARTSGLLELAERMRRIEGAPGVGFNVSMFGPFRPAGALTPALRLTRPATARAALKLTAPAVRDVSRQAPRTAEALLEQLLLEGDFEP